jgi:putative transposase
MPAWMGLLLKKRQAVYEAARARHPQRWRGAIRNWQRIQVVHLNPDQADAKVNDPKKQKTGIEKAA